MNNIEREIEQLDWHLATALLSPPLFRAEQGHFFTAWRDKPEQVLADVRAIKEKQKEAS